MSEFQIDISVQSYLEDLTSQKRLAGKFEAPKYGKSEHSEILQEEFTHESVGSKWRAQEQRLVPGAQQPGPVQTHSGTTQQLPRFLHNSLCTGQTNQFTVVKLESSRKTK